MQVDAFDFTLPPERIALRPATPRDAARLLLLRSGDQGQLEDLKVTDLPKMLEPGDLLVFNDTKVIPARLYGLRLSEHSDGARIEVLLHHKLDASRWTAFARPAKKLKRGDRIRFGAAGGECEAGTLDACVEAKAQGGEVTLAFDYSGPVLDAAIASHGEMPLPPYIASKRNVDMRDSVDYQTVYARCDGAIAAPTAGLHFSDRLLKDVAERGVESAFVTLHVGAGTFLPVKAEDTSDHQMHAEWGEVSAATAMKINEARKRGGRVIAVGTTVLRLLETAVADDGSLKPFAASTDIFITPGYRFRAVDALWTNFHLPRSTLFMLVCAFAGLENMKRAYEHAIARGYRFYSYGDASLLFPEKP